MTDRLKNAARAQNRPFSAMAKAAPQARNQVGNSATFRKIAPLLPVFVMLSSESMASRVLITTLLGDAHSAAIAAELEKRLVPCDIWDSRHFPLTQGRTFSIEEGRLRFVMTEEGRYRELGDYSCIWQRRPGRPLCDALPLHPDDQEYAGLQALSFYEMSEILFSSTPNFWPDIKWVNDPGHATRAESKMLQLATAADLGMFVPPTIISNSPEAIRKFLSKHESVICKSLDPFRWVEEGEVYCNLSARVDGTSISSDRMLSSCPEIYQAEIKRSRELRLFFAGPYESGVEICPSREEEQSVDWRIYHESKSATRALTQIPVSISRECRRLLDRMGLVTASIDLLEDSEGRVFLADVNQAGQFLWMEEFGVGVIDGFTSFLVAMAHGELDTGLGQSVGCGKEAEEANRVEA